MRPRRTSPLPRRWKATASPPSRCRLPSWCPSLPVRSKRRPTRCAPIVPTGVSRCFDATFGDRWLDEAKGLAARPPLDLRVNTLKADRARVLGVLQGVGAAAAPLAPDGIRIPPIAGDGRHPNVQAEPAFQKGWFEVQDEGSQLVAALAAPASAGPGSRLLRRRRRQDAGHFRRHGKPRAGLRPRFGQGAAGADLRAPAARRQPQRPGGRQHRGGPVGVGGRDGRRGGRRPLHGQRHLAPPPRCEVAADRTAAGGAHRRAGGDPRSRRRVMCDLAAAWSTSRAPSSRPRTTASSPLSRRGGPTLPRSTTGPLECSAFPATPMPRGSTRSAAFTCRRSAPAPTASFSAPSGEDVDQARRRPTLPEP